MAPRSAWSRRWDGNHSVHAAREARPRRRHQETRRHEEARHADEHNSAGGDGGGQGGHGSELRGWVVGGSFGLVGLGVRGSELVRVRGWKWGALAAGG